MRPTADQVIQEYDALSSEEKGQVYYNIVIKKVAMSEFTHGLNPAVTKAINTAIKGSYRQSRGSRRGKVNAQSQKIYWKNILVDFVPNQYIQNYEEIWQIESILGSDVVRKGLSKYHILDANFIERLFSQAPYSFYINQPETYLFSDYGDISESNGGPLKQLTALDALQRYGLKLMEESKEKQYVRL